MRRVASFGLFVLVVVAHAIAQSDDEPRLCDGMPTSQLAFAQSLAAGSLKRIAYTDLKSGAGTNQGADSLFRALFQPSPTSMLDLVGRIDLLIASRDVPTANKLELDLNREVAEAIAAVHSRDNIACSISLLSYREAADVFGKRIATQYGVVQITIRNTDADHEFLLHQVDYWFGDTLQYFATRDRKIARGVAEKGQVVDPRNAAVRVLETAGHIAAASTIPFGGDAQIGSSIFNSTVVPGIKTIFPDLTVPQIAKLDDMGFSAGSNSMVIPKSGAISIVGLIPSDSVLAPKLAQYEELVAAATPATSDQLNHCASLELTLSQSSDGRQASQQDIQTCNKLLASSPTPLSGALSPQSITASSSKSKKTTISTVAGLGLVGKKPKNIGNFDPTAVLLLQRDLHILVAGSHIQAVPDQPTLTGVACVVPARLVHDATLTCKVSGNNLNLISDIKLVGKTESTDVVSASSPGVSSTDRTQLAISFSACSFDGKNSTEYLVQFSDNRDVQHLSSATVGIPPVPFVDCPPTGQGNYTCSLKNWNDATGGTVSLKSATSAPPPFPADGSSHTVTLAAGTFTATVTPTGGSPVQLCRTFRVP